MKHHKLVLPEHMNHYGFLFGGYLLKWVDEVAWIAASLDYPGCKFVTVGMDKVEFHESVHNGTILEFSAVKERVGNTSVCYAVDVRDGEASVFSTKVTFVRVGEDGGKLALEG